MYSKSARAVVLLMLAFSGGASVALDADKTFWSYGTDFFAQERSLPMAGADVLRDRENIVWYGTRDGLVRVAGEQTRTYDLHSTPELISNHIVRLAEDSRGALHALSAHGLAIEHADSFRGLDFHDHPVGTLRDMAIDAQDRVWIAAVGGLFELVDDALIARYSSQPLSVVRATDAGLWAGGPGFVAQWRDNVLAVTQFSREHHQRVVSDVAIRGAEIWVGTDRGLFLFRNGELARSGHAELDQVEIATLSSDRGGNLWIGGPEVFARIYPDGRLEVPTLGSAEFGFSPNLVRIYDDPDGNSWHVSSSFGALVVHEQIGHRVSATEGLDRAEVRSVTTAKDGSLLVGTSGALHRVRDMIPSTIVGEKELGGAAVNDILELEGFWVATSTGVKHVDAVSGVQSPPALQGAPAYSLASHRGALWAGTENGLYETVNGAFTPVLDFPRRAVHTLMEGADGALWAGTNRGLYRVADDGTVELQGRETPLARAAISALVQLDQDRVAAVSRDFGIFVQEGGGWRHPSRQLDLPNVGATFAGLDGAGSLWVAGANGIAAIAVNELTDPDATTAQVHYVAHPSGVARGSRELYCCAGVGNRNGVFTDGRFWIASDDGIVGIDPLEVAGRVDPPRVYIDTVTTAGRNIDPTQPIALDANEKDIVVTFSARLLLGLDHVRYRIKMDGRHDDWVDAGDSTTVRLTNLEPGEYLFRVQASLEEDAWGPESTLVVSRQAIFWETLWFRGAVAVLVALLLFVVIAFRFRRLAAQKQRVEELVTQRTAELTDSNTRLEASLGELSAAHELAARLSRRAGQADVASEIMHNLGNVLNSVSVSTQVLADRLDVLSGQQLRRVTQMLRDRGDSTGGDTVIEYLDKLAVQMDEKADSARSEVGELRNHVSHISSVIQGQQAAAQGGGVEEICSARDLLAEAVRLNSGSFAKHGITVSTQADEDVQICTDRHQVLQILVNVIKNAKEAMVDTHSPDRHIELSLCATPSDVYIGVTDTGCGLAPEAQREIFQQGFTTKQSGSGIGLHSAANSAKRLGGDLSVTSEGPGLGARFTLRVPIGLPEALAE